MRLRSGFEKGQTKSKSEESTSASGTTVTRPKRTVEKESSSTSRLTGARPKRTSKKDYIQLSGSIWMFRNKKISTHGEIYEGELRSNDTRRIVLKLVENISCGISEARILAKLNNHKHVLSLIQHGTLNFRFDDRIYIALDKCHHENLREFVTNRKNQGFAFDLSRAIEIAGQMVDGVKHIHENRIIHKDIKPDNILFSFDLKFIKIADFGQSQEIDSTSTEVFEESQFGTDGFRPPESFGRGIISQKSDIFSLGVTFYFVLSNGEHPFGDDRTGWNHHMKNRKIPELSLSEHMTNIITAKHLIKSMIAHKINHRPTIWQVSEHPFWTGNEVSCDIDYHCPESAVSLIPQTSDEPSFDIADVDQHLEHLENIQQRDEAAAADIRQRTKDSGDNLVAEVQVKLTTEEAEMSISAYRSAVHNISCLQDLYDVDTSSLGSVVSIHQQIPDDLFNKLKQIVSKRHLAKLVLNDCFDDPERLCEILKALRGNGNIKRLSLDLRKNKHNLDCAREISKLISRKVLVSLALPEGFDESCTAEILHEVTNSRSKLKLLNISESVLNEDAIKYLEEILKNRNVIHKLILKKCEGASGTTLTTKAHDKLADAEKKGRRVSWFYYRKLDITWFNYVTHAESGDMDPFEWEITEIEEKIIPFFKGKAGRIEKVVRFIAINKYDGHRLLVNGRKRRADESTRLEKVRIEEVDEKLANLFGKPTMDIGIIAQASVTANVHIEHMNLHRDASLAGVGQAVDNESCTTGSSAASNE